METHKLPWVGRCKPGADLHRCHQSGQWLARICSLVSQRAIRTKDWNVLRHSERFHLGEKIAMTSPQPKTPLAQQVRKKSKKLKVNSSSPSPQIQLSMLVSTPSNKLHSIFSFIKKEKLPLGPPHCWVMVENAYSTGTPLPSSSTVCPAETQACGWHSDSDFRGVKANACVRVLPLSWPTFLKVSHLWLLWDRKCGSPSE